ncbi:hypothetical protein H6P81_002564 [Aristolochia fimbriata]|uniref:Uncharacterized protein n=1 Tax=Aristolochia fimbriata TaxID=158543 RepID=A0AAV7FDY6_ARIFI|nr:hypothetical protein H6P81_002564 [Aristolochia fimbriata]
MSVGASVMSAVNVLGCEGTLRRHFPKPHWYPLHTVNRQKLKGRIKEWLKAKGLATRGDVDIFFHPLHHACKRPTFHPVTVPQPFNIGASTGFTTPPRRSRILLKEVILKQVSLNLLHYRLNSTFHYQHVQGKGKELSPPSSSSQTLHSDHLLPASTHDDSTDPLSSVTDNLYKLTLSKESEDVPQERKDTALVGIVMHGSYPRFPCSG